MHRIFRRIPKHMIYEWEWLLAILTIQESKKFSLGNEKRKEETINLMKKQCAVESFEDVGKTNV